MKQFTVVFPVFRENNSIFILLGEQPEGRPLAGYINGYGGKVESGETVEVAAKRELFEELGVIANTVTEVGKVVIGEKEIIFFLTEIPKLDFGDKDEMIHNTWYNLADNSFISKMIPGDDVLIEHVRKVAPKFFNHEPVEIFSLIKEGTAIHEATQGLDGNTRLLK